VSYTNAKGLERSSIRPIKMVCAPIVVATAKALCVRRLDVTQKMVLAHALSDITMALRTNVSKSSAQRAWMTPAALCWQHRQAMKSVVAVPKGHATRSVESANANPTIGVTTVDTRNALQVRQAMSLGDSVQHHLTCVMDVGHAKVRRPMMAKQAHASAAAIIITALHVSSHTVVVVAVTRTSAQAKVPASPSQDSACVMQVLLVATALSAVIANTRAVLPNVATKATVIGSQASASATLAITTEQRAKSPVGMRHTIRTGVEPWINGAGRCVSMAGFSQA